MLKIVVSEEMQRCARHMTSHLRAAVWIVKSHTQPHKSAAMELVNTSSVRGFLRSCDDLTEKIRCLIQKKLVKTYLSRWYYALTMRCERGRREFGGPPKNIYSCWPPSPISYTVNRWAWRPKYSGRWWCCCKTFILKVKCLYIKLQLIKI